MRASCEHNIILFNPFWTGLQKDIVKKGGVRLFEKEIF
jgi:hypothetical protein